MPNNVYQRILVKMSGEALAGDAGFGISTDILDRIVQELVEARSLGVEIGVVIGGGNLFRGAELARAGLDRVTGDYMGMLGTVMNALAVRDGLRGQGLKSEVLSSFPLGPVCPVFSRDLAREYLDDGRIVIFAGGTGNPYFTTDTAASLRAVEIGANAMFKATKVDGIYTDDPETNPEATMYETVTYDEALEKQLAVMDASAIVMCRDNNLPLRVFNLLEHGNLCRVIRGENIGTTVLKGL